MPVIRLILICSVLLSVSSTFAGEIPFFYAEGDSLSKTAILDSAVIIEADDSSDVMTITAEVDTVKIKRHSPALAMWLSFATPGGGQLYNRKYLKTLIIGGGEIGIIYSIAYYHHRHKNARRDGDTDASDFYKENRNRMSWWLTGIILYSMADAYVDGQLWNFELSRDLSLGFAPGTIFIKLEF